MFYCVSMYIKDTSSAINIYMKFKSVRSVILKTCIGGNEHPEGPQKDSAGFFCSISFTVDTRHSHIYASYTFEGLFAICSRSHAAAGTLASNGVLHGNHSLSAVLKGFYGLLWWDQWTKEEAVDGIKMLSSCRNAEHGIKNQSSFICVWKS